MATMELTSENFQTTILNNDMIIIDFWAEWCGPYKKFGPTFETISENHQSIVFAKCYREKQQEIAKEFGIQSIPTFAIMRVKILLFSQPGAIPRKCT